VSEVRIADRDGVSTEPDALPSTVTLPDVETDKEGSEDRVNVAELPRAVVAVAVGRAARVRVGEAIGVWDTEPDGFADSEAVRYGLMDSVAVEDWSADCVAVRDGSLESVAVHDGSADWVAVWDGSMESERLKEAESVNSQERLTVQSVVPDVLVIAVDARGVTK
jgi:hypothetical protein